MGAGIMDDAYELSTLCELAKLYNVESIARPGPPCFLCNARGLFFGICNGCFGDLPWRRQSGNSFDFPFIQTTLVAFDYAYPLDRIIRRAKFSSDMAALKLCGTLLSSRVSNHLPELDLIVPVPLSTRRYISRSYNQAVEIARPLSIAKGIPLGRDVVRRCLHRPAQSTLPAAARAGNVRGAFWCTEVVEGTRILIVDDVITTGATVVELARSLSAAGAAEIHLAAFAAS